MGKRTTTRHKEDNTFRFQTFEEKLRQISVNVNLSIRDGRGENPEGKQTFFSQEIEKWVDLNRTEAFADLLCKIGTDSKTLPQLILQNDKLSKILLEHLENGENVPSFEPTFALVIALSRDLGEEFYPQFHEFFRVIVKIVMESKNTNIIEAGFKCYAYLSKYLRRQIIKDLQHHMKQFSCFLDPKLKTYVMIFACEAFSIVSGKFARDYPQKFLKLVYAVFLRKHPEHAIGVATLLFAIFKGVGATLKLRGPGLQFKDCTSFLHGLESDEEKNIWTTVLSNLSVRLLNHANASSSEDLMHLVEELVMEDLKENRTVANLLSVYSSMISHNNAGKLTDVSSCASVLQSVSSVVSASQINDLLATIVVGVVESKCSSNDTKILSQLQPAISNILKNASYSTVESLDKCLRSFTAYFRMFLEPIIEAYTRNEKPAYIKECHNLLVYCLSEAILQQGGLYEIPSGHYFTGNTSPMHYFQGQKRITAMINASSLKGVSWDCCSMMKPLQEDLEASGVQEDSINYSVRLLLVFSRLNSKNCESCLQSCISILSKIIHPNEELTSNVKIKVLPLIYYILQVLISQVTPQASFYEQVPIKHLLNYLDSTVDGATTKSSFSLWGLKSLDLLTYFLQTSNHLNYEADLKEFILRKWDSLANNLLSGFRMIRAITLSVLRGTHHLTKSGTEKTLEMLDKFLELEDMSLTNNTFSSLAKSILTECKVIVGSENYDVHLKMLCVKYTLGLLYTNYNLIWNPCVEVICHGGKHIDMQIYWETVGYHFCKNQDYPSQTDEELITSILPDIDEDCSDFMKMLTVDTFGLPKSEACYSGLEEQLDITQYKSHLWQSLKGQPLSKKEYGDIKRYVDEVMNDSTANVSDDEEKTQLTRREKAKMIIPMLQFLETCDLVNVNHELWETALKFLMYPQEVQKAAWKFLFAKRKSKLKNYKDDIDEIINVESMDPVHKFRVDAIDTSLNKQYENETSERRSLLMEILVRILIGKERVMKGEKRLQVLRFLAGCTESDAKRYLGLTVGTPDELKQLPPKIIEIKINKMTSALRTWRYTFPNVLDQIINSVCDLTCSISTSIKAVPRKSLDPNELPDDVFEEQKKAALKAGRMCAVAFFSSLPRLDMKAETLVRIFDVFIWPSLDDITVTSVGSVSWILKLFLVWSTHERYHVLFTKCKDNNVNQSPMWRLFDLLDSKSTVFEVKKYILGIILNLTNPPDILNDPDEPTEEYLQNSSNSPLSITETYQFTTTETTGINIVLLRKDVILNLFQDAQTFKKFTTQTGGDSCLSLISLLAGFAVEGELNSKLCGVIIDTFPMCKNNEENLANSISAVGKLLFNVENSFDLIMKLAHSFTWVSGRRLRTTLVKSLECMQGTPLFEVISGINAWADMAADTPNFSLRQESFEKAGKLIEDGSFDHMSYTLIFYNCVYNINHEDDIGMRNSAKQILIAMASALPQKSGQCGDTRTGVHKFLDSIILPKFRGCIHEKDDKRFEDILNVLFAFINSSHELHGTFRELRKILSAEIIDGLCDIQVHLRTRAMNKLSKRMKEIGNDVSPAVVQAFILPIATHNLFDENRLAKNFNELIDSSIEVLRDVMLAVPHDQYFSYLNKLLDDPKKNTKLAKQFERVLIAIMDSFHFDLSLGSVEKKIISSNEDPVNVETKSDSKPPEPSNESALVADTNSGLNTAEKGDGDDSDREEFNIGEKEAVPTTLTLIPQPAAVKCLGILKSQIIPKLRKFLHFEEKATHKLSKATKTVDEDVILKIPCTIALVKLLKKIPKAEGQNGIRAIIPSITAGLRNELVSVRNTLRKTLLNVVKELGTSHLKVVIGYLKSSLLRGYQRHVLNYTVAYLLRCLESDLKANPDHVPVKEILPLCEEELYGTMQEEKEVQAIKQKTREASKSNACPILKVCGKCVSSVEQLNAMINPAVKQLSEKKSLKVAKSSRQWLLAVTEGLADNNTVDCYELLVWLLQVVRKDGKMVGENSQSEQSEKNSGEQPPNKKRKLLETPKDSKLIPVLKKQTTSDAKLGGLSLLMEFGFSCLYSGLNKSGRFKERMSSKEALVLLDMFVPFLADGVKASSKQVNVVSLRCTTLLMEFDLSSFKKPEIIEKLQRNGFVAMSAHCYRNTTDSEITNSTFKFLSGFFVRFPDFKIALQDFELMLKCIQGYLTDGNCSSSALTLLRGVLQNKYRCTILPDLMQEVFKQCITSYYQHINEGCRLAYIAYLNNYLTNPKDLYVEVQLILRQFDYEHESGRATAVEILSSLLQNIPEDCFEEVKELIFLKLLATLDKEKHAKVRERLGSAMQSLFRIEKKKSLTRILLKLLVLDKHVPELDTFFLIIGLLISDPKIFDNADMVIIIERIKEVLNPESLQKMCADNTRVSQQIKDYMIFQAVVAFKKALSRNVFDMELWDCNSPLNDNIEEIFCLLRSTYLLYEHEWVPLITVDILSIVLNKLQLTEEMSKASVANCLEEEKPVCAFLKDKESLHDLMNKLWVAMKKSEREDVLAKGAYALVLLVSVAARLEDKKMFVNIVDSMRKSVNGEVVKNPRVTTIRTVAMGCFRGITKTSPRDAIEQVAEIMTRVAVRELTDDNVPQELKNECEKLISVVRDLIGHSEYNVIHARVNDFFYKKRNLNRAKKKEKVMLHPGLVRKRPKKSKPDFHAKKKRKMK